MVRSGWSCAKFPKKGGQSSDEEILHNIKTYPVTQIGQLLLPGSLQKQTPQKGAVLLLSDTV